MPKHGRIQPKSRRCAVYGNVRGTRISNNRHAFAARAEPIHVPTFRGCKIELAVAARAGDPQEGFEAGMRPKLMRALRSALGLDAQALKIGIEQVAEDDTFRMHNTHDDSERAHRLRGGCRMAVQRAGNMAYRCHAIILPPH